MRESEIADGNHPLFEMMENVYLPVSKELRHMYMCISTVSIRVFLDHLYITCDLLKCSLPTIIFIAANVVGNTI